jgi:hypothetical protein
MLNLPNCVRKSLAGQWCVHCRRQLRLSGVEAVGLRKRSETLIPEVEIRCHCCGELTEIAFTTIPLTLEEFAAEMQAASYRLEEPADAEDDPIGHRLTDDSPKGPRLRFVCEGRQRDDGIHLFGGYRSTRSGASVLLYRRWRSGHPPYDGLVRLAAHAKAWITEPRDDESIEAHDWDRFLSLKTNALFGLEGVKWRKMTTTELRKITRRRYRFQPPKDWAEGTL